VTRRNRALRAEIYPRLEIIAEKLCSDFRKNAGGTTFGGDFRQAVQSLAEKLCILQRFSG